MGGGTPKRDDSRSPARPDLAYAQPALRARHVWRSRCVYRSQPSPSPSGTVCSAPADLVSPEGVLRAEPSGKALVAVSVHRPETALLGYVLSGHLLELALRHVHLPPTLHVLDDV